MDRSGGQIDELVPVIELPPEYCVTELTAWVDGRLARRLPPGFATAVVVTGDLAATFADRAANPDVHASGELHGEGASIIAERCGSL